MNANEWQRIKPHLNEYINKPIGIFIEKVYLDATLDDCDEHIITVHDTQRTFKLSVTGISDISYPGNIDFLM